MRGRAGEEARRHMELRAVTATMMTPVEWSQSWIRSSLRRLLNLCLNQEPLSWLAERAPPIWSGRFPARESTFSISGATQSSITAWTLKYLESTTCTLADFPRSSKALNLCSNSGLWMRFGSRAQVARHRRCWPAMAIPSTAASLGGHRERPGCSRYWDFGRPRDRSGALADRAAVAKFRRLGFRPS